MNRTYSEETFPVQEWRGAAERSEWERAVLPSSTEWEHTPHPAQVGPSKKAWRSVPDFYSRIQQFLEWLWRSSSGSQYYWLHCSSTKSHYLQSEMQSEDPTCSRVLWAPECDRIAPMTRVWWKENEEETLIATKRELLATKLENKN